MHDLKHFIDPQLIDRLRTMDRLTACARSVLSRELAQHCWATRVEGTTLYLVANAASWATPIRYQQHEILKQVNAEFGHILARPVTRVRIKLSQERPPATESESRRVSVPDTAARSLETAARAVADPELSSALLRLAGRAPEP